MKTIFLKQVFPVAVFAVAIAGAFTTNAMEKARRTADLVDSYKKLNIAGDCDEQQFTCDRENTGNICRVSANPASQQLYAKNDNGDCVVEVYRPQ